ESRWRRSSPRTYSRCCTNSTEWPKNGLLCMPVMKPSTTCWARRSSRLMRAITVGSRKRRGLSTSRVAAKGGPHLLVPELCLGTFLAKLCFAPIGQGRREAELRRQDVPKQSSGTRILGRENLPEPLVLRQLALAAGRLLDQPLDDRVGGHALAGGGEVGQDA